MKPYLIFPAATKLKIIRTEIVNFLCNTVIKNNSSHKMKTSHIRQMIVINLSLDITYMILVGWSCFLNIYYSLKLRLYSFHPALSVQHFFQKKSSSYEYQVQGLSNCVKLSFNLCGRKMSLLLVFRRPYLIFAAATKFSYEYQVQGRWGLWGDMLHKTWASY